MKKNFGVKTFLYPMPVLIISTYDEFGNPNAMNAAWGGICDYDKISIALSGHKTTENILKNKAFCVSVGEKKYVKECDYVGIVSAKKEPNKLEKSGFSVTKSEFVNAPVINELPMVLECELVSYENEVLIGKIINVGVNEEILGADNLPDLNKFSPLTFDPVHHKYIALGEEVAEAFKVGKTK